MNEDYVSYELAVALKTAGFDEPCDHYYTPNKAMRIVKDNALAPETANNRFLDEIADGCCTAVPLWQAQKWLREKKGIVVSVHPEGKFLKDERTYKHTGWGYSIICINKNSNMAPGPIGHVLMAKYEQALSVGISAALGLITKGE